MPAPCARAGCSPVAGRSLLAGRATRPSVRPARSPCGARRRVACRVLSCAFCPAPARRRHFASLAGRCTVRARSLCHSVVTGVSLLAQPRALPRKILPSYAHSVVHSPAHICPHTCVSANSIYQLRALDHARTDTLQMHRSYEYPVRNPPSAAYPCAHTPMRPSLQLPTRLIYISQPSPSPIYTTSIAPAQPHHTSHPPPLTLLRARLQSAPQPTLSTPTTYTTKPSHPPPSTSSTPCTTHPHPLTSHIHTKHLPTTPNPNPNHPLTPPPLFTSSNPFLHPPTYS